jgi:methylthioribose-1-phosphate isomerase
MAHIKSECTGEVRPVYWDGGRLHMIDQRLLPGTLKVVSVGNVDEVVAAIKDMLVRGAPAIGAAGAFGMAMAAEVSSAATS